MDIVRTRQWAMSDDMMRRLPIALLGLFFVGLGICVAMWGVWESHGRIASRPPVTVLVDSAARWMALSVACFGVGLLGVLYQRRGIVAAWMTLWLIVAVAVNFVEPVVCQRMDQFTMLCQ